tara:strand:- start:1218 stop:1490 length:273 start_codon:yes stop_codon:yes gene_type:complete
MKDKSYLTPEYISGLVDRHGFNKQLKLGNFKGARTEVLALTEGYHFRNPNHKYRCREAINKCRDMIQLYTALFNLMYARNYPTEKLSRIL